MQGVWRVPSRSPPEWPLPTLWEPEVVYLEFCFCSKSIVRFRWKTKLLVNRSLIDMFFWVIPLNGSNKDGVTTQQEQFCLAVEYLKDLFFLLFKKSTRKITGACRICIWKSTERQWLSRVWIFLNCPWQCVCAGKKKSGRSLYNDVVGKQSTGWRWTTSNDSGARSITATWRCAATSKSLKRELNWAAAAAGNPKTRAASSRALTRKGFAREKMQIFFPTILPIWDRRVRRRKYLFF